MGKIYSVLALAAAVSVNAVAASVNLDAQKTATSIAPNAQELSMTANDKSKAIAKELNYTTAEEMVGAYIVHTYSGFDSDDHEVTLYIDKGEGANEVIIYGMWNGFGKTATIGGVGIKGTVSNSSGKCTISIPTQQIASFDDGTAVYAYPYDFYNGGQKDVWTFTVCPYGVTYTDGSSGYEEGCIACLDGYTGIALSTPELIIPNASGNISGYSMWYGTFLCPIDLYGTETQQIVEINESEWTSLGNGKFTDGYIYPLTTGEVLAPYDVEILQKNDGSNVFLLKNPYGATAPADYKAQNADVDGTGYIYIDATAADCVCVRPLVYSGMNDLEGWEGRQYMSNEEGVMYFIDEATIEDILDTMEYYEMTPSTMVENNDQVTITINNGLLAQVTDLFTYAPWTNSSGSPIPCDSKVTFTKTGVNSIVDDAANGVKRYFNLQGMEVVNPEAGQVVIVREGNKSSKTIVR